MKNVNVSLAYAQHSAKQFLTKEPFNFLAEYQSGIELSKKNPTPIRSTAIIFSSDGNGLFLPGLNHDSVTNSGAELFGEVTEDSFVELSQYNQGGSGWI